MNLGTGRIIVIIALVLGGVVLLANGFGDGGTSAATPGGSSSPTATTTATTGPTQTVTPTATPTPLPPKKVVVAVFNGTNVLGLAAQGQDILDEAGYKKGQEPDNSPVPMAKTTVYFRPGPDEAQNQSDATAIADTYFGEAKVAQLGGDLESLVDPDVQVVVVLGDDYAKQQA